ncbi:hypothetical protein OAE84_00520, partial [bacterium]|nr:hypothetical protein [bacterium]
MVTKNSNHGAGWPRMSPAAIPAPAIRCLPVREPDEISVPARVEHHSGSSPGAESDDSNVFRGRAFLALHNIKF